MFSLLMQFDTVSIADLDELDLDTLDFGVVRMDPSGIVVNYNKRESEISGLSPERVIGRAFFPDVAICMHNFMVSHRYDESADLDEMLDYVLTVRMDPKPVKLRLLQRADGPFRYLLVQPV